MRRTFILLILFVAFNAPAVAQQPLHERIDTLLRQTGFVTHPKRASDQEFVRRIYLDLAGVIPLPSEASALVADPEPNKRALLIARLLDSPHYVRHLSQTFDLLLLQRRKDREKSPVKAVQWQQFLYRSFQQNKSWKRIAREVLSSTGVNQNTHAAIRFYLERQGDIDRLARDISSSLLGKNLRCAQCHDHPTIDDYHQRDFYGLAAFYTRTSVKSYGGRTVIGETASGDTNYTSVLTKESGKTDPRVFTAPSVIEPTSLRRLAAALAKLQNQIQIQDKQIKLAQQKHQKSQKAIVDHLAVHRKAIAALAATESASQKLTQALAAAAKKPSSTALQQRILAQLQRLASQRQSQLATVSHSLVALQKLQAGDGQLGAAARQAVKKKEQLGKQQITTRNALYKVPPGGKQRPQPKFSRFEQLAEQVTKHPAFASNMANRMWALMFGRGIVEPLDMHHSNNAPTHPALLKLLSSEFVASGFDIHFFLQELAQTELYNQTSEGIPIGKAESLLYLRVRKLTPHQMARSVMRATGRTTVVQRRIRSHLKGKDDKTRLRFLWNPSFREQRTDLALAKDLELFVGPFVTSVRGEDVRSEYSPNQALFLLNGQLLQSWLKPQDKNLVDRLSRMKSAKQITAVAFTTVLSRSPSASEIRRVEKQLAVAKNKTERVEAIQDIVWSLISSSEFRFTH